VNKAHATQPNNTITTWKQQQGLTAREEPNTNYANHPFMVF